MFVASQRFLDNGILNSSAPSVICQPSKGSRWLSSRWLISPIPLTCAIAWWVHTNFHQPTVQKPFFYEWTKRCPLTPCVCAQGPSFALIWNDPITASQLCEELIFFPVLSYVTCPGVSCPKVYLERCGNLCFTIKRCQFIHFTFNV